MPIANTVAPAEISPARTSPASPGQRRFTVDGSDALENRLARACQEVLAGIQNIVPRHQLEALLLAGGYGRGEGGVLKTRTGDQPYNDLEFYVFVRGRNWLNERRFGSVLHHLSRELSPLVNLEVELKVISLAKLRRSPVSMFYYDLVMGHRWLSGNEKLLIGCEHHRNARNIPLCEVTRLLMNRCSGLLFARERLDGQVFTAEDADFVNRNIAKAKLALGDALLTAFGQYHWSCRERQERLQRLVVGENLPWLAQVQHHYLAGVEFKLHPQRTAGSQAFLREMHDEVASLALRVWLWVESRRLKHDFSSARAYALSPLNKSPETSPWRNCLVNAKTMGLMSSLHPRARRHPCERLLNALALLLWESDLANPALTHCLQRELAIRHTTQASLLHAYRSLWQRLNA